MLLVPHGCRAGEAEARAATLLAGHGDQKSPARGLLRRRNNDFCSARRRLELRKGRRLPVWAASPHQQCCAWCLLDEAWLICIGLPGLPQGAHAQVPMHHHATAHPASTVQLFPSSRSPAGSIFDNTLGPRPRSPPFESPCILTVFSTLRLLFRLELHLHARAHFLLASTVNDQHQSPTPESLRPRPATPVVITQSRWSRIEACIVHCKPHLHNAPLRTFILGVASGRPGIGFLSSGQVESALACLLFMKIALAYILGVSQQIS